MNVNMRDPGLKKIKSNLLCFRSQSSRTVLMNVHIVCGTYWYWSASLRRGDHVRGQSLWRVNALADFLLDKMHSEGKLLSGELAYLPGVCQGPAGKSSSVNGIHSEQT